MDGVNLDFPLAHAAKVLAKSRIPHRTFEQAIKRIWQTASVAQPGEVVICVGPSRVGKSRAIRDAMARFERPVDAQSEHSMPPVSRPVLSLRIRNSSKNARLRSKDFYAQALSKQHHPIFGFTDAVDHKGRTLATVIRDTAEDRLVEAFSQTLIAEQTKFLVLDEIQHLRYMEGGRDGPIRMLDSLKTLAEEKGFVLVLAGAYPVLDFLEQTPHLLGRSFDFEFARYRFSDDDKESFCAVLDTIEVLIPWQGEPLATYLDYLLTNSLGCVGLLMKWFREATTHAGNDDRGAMQLSDLEASVLNRRKRQALLAEIDSGEARWHRNPPAGSEADDQFRPASAPDNGDSKSPNPKRKKPFTAKNRNYSLGGRT